MDTKKHIAKADRQLSDTTKYKKLQNVPTLQHNKLVNNAINHLTKEKLLPNNITNGLTTFKSRTPKVYMAPKLHKPNNQGRAVVSSDDCHISNISQYVLTIISNRL